MSNMTPYLWVVALSVGLSACGDMATLAPEAGMGTKPTLPPPKTSWIPTVHVADARGWLDGNKPQPASGLAVKAFAQGLEHPRWLYVLPNGDVLVAETNAPAGKSSGGVRAWFTGLFMKRAGASVPSPDRITLLRDADRDGVAETRTVFLQGLHSPFGMALVGNDFYVANTDAVLRFPYRAGQTEIREAGTKIVDLPANEPNYHWARNLIASSDGKRLYVTIGSNSNFAEHGIASEQGRAAIMEIMLNSGQHQTFVSGLRNANGLAWHGDTLWTVVNERDELGSDLVPDYLTSVRRGGFYGWPYSYYGAHVDDRVQPQRPDLVAQATVPDYALGAHSAALGLTFYDGKLLPRRYMEGAFVALHGSWNRKPLSGYKVVFVPFAGGKPTGMPEDVLTGFVNEKDEAYGRPVGLAVDSAGALLVADDVGNKVWRITPAS